MNAHRWGPLLCYAAACALLLAVLGRRAAGFAHALQTGLPFAAGLFCGFALAVAVGTLWVFIAGPVQELILERFFDPPQPAPALGSPPDGPQGVLVSDLHIDTWGLSDGRPNARESRLLGLLAAIKSDPRVDSFFLNGDLMDIPLHPDANAPEPEMLRLGAMLLDERGVLLSRYDAVLGALLTLTRPDPASPAQVSAPIRRALFQTGNHDVGVSGLRYVRPDMPPFLPPVQSVWNPSLLIQTGADGQELPRWVYIEHGHRWDPLLWLYMRYALLDILRAGHRRREAQLLSGMQRAGKAGMGAQQMSPGASLPPAPARDTSANHFPDDQPGLLSTLVRLRYRQAARRLVPRVPPPPERSPRRAHCPHTADGPHAPPGPLRLPQRPDLHQLRRLVPATPTTAPTASSTPTGPCAAPSSGKTPTRPSSARPLRLERALVKEYPAPACKLLIMRGDFLIIVGQRTEESN